MTVTAVMVVRAEPLDRLRRALASLGSQRAAGRFELVIAAPGEEHPRLRALDPTGAVERIILVDNPGGARSAGLNAAIAQATGDVVVRVDARSVLPPDYVARCVSRLAADPRVGVVGGVQRPTSDSARHAGAVRALRNPWALGGAQYRRPGASGSVDTVYLGVFRRADVTALGGFDPRLDANEDFELCARYHDAGFLIWLEDALAVDYEPRASLRELWQQYYAFGTAKVAFWRRTGRRPAARQAVAIGAGAGVVAATVVTGVLRPDRAWVVPSLAAAGVVLVDHVADPAERRVGVRAAACASIVVIAGGWLAGIVGGCVGQDRSRAS